jgi:N-acetyl-gamma-glutamyl-phosphate/LysW-gamma-L-alpha-aminoadipyl-6-phosphate reductase
MRAGAVVVGAAGYGGGELVRLLRGHPGFDLLALVSRSHAGAPLASVHPRLAGDDDPTAFVAEPPWDLLARRPGPLVVFSALRAGELRSALAGWRGAWAERGLEERLLLVDLAPDFRAEALAGQDVEGLRFVYGSSEWCGEELRGARAIANPGCFATALALALIPLARETLVSDAVACAVTGSSGSGAVASERTHHPTRAQEFVAYAPLAHRHQPEVEGLLRRVARPLPWAFVPHSGPFVRGIAATVVGRLVAGATEAEVAAAYRRAYAGRPQVRLRRAPPRLGAVVGTPYADLAWRVEGERVAVFVALDNLGKGMATQAMANTNLALGRAEMEGLGGGASHAPI